MHYGSSCIYCPFIIWLLFFGLQTGADCSKTGLVNVLYMLFKSFLCFVYIFVLYIYLYVLSTNLSICYQQFLWKQWFSILSCFTFMSCYKNMVLTSTFLSIGWNTSDYRHGKSGERCKRRSPKFLGFAEIGTPK